MNDVTVSIGVDAKEAVAAVNELTAAVTRATEAIANLQAMLGQSVAGEIAAVDNTAMMQPVVDAIANQTSVITQAVARALRKGLA